MIALAPLVLLVPQLAFSGAALACALQGADASPAVAQVLGEARELLDAARREQAAGDPDAARAHVAEALETVLARTGWEADPAAAALLEQIGDRAREAGDLRTTARALTEALDARDRSLGADDPVRLLVLQKLAGTVFALGDVAGARRMFEEILESRTRTLPADHPDLQAARGNLASMLWMLGDLQGARELQVSVLEAFERTLPADHPNVQYARQGLALTLSQLGDQEGALELQQAALEVYERKLPDDHPDLQALRLNLGSTMYALGRLSEARALYESAHDVRARTLPPDHHDLLKAKQGLAGVLSETGELQRALEVYESIVAAYGRTLPANHPDVLAVRGNVAWTRWRLGDVQAANAMLEDLLEDYSGVLPADHPDVVLTLSQLAGTRLALGDLEDARALFEQVLETRSRTLPPDHPELQDARANLAVAIKDLGDLEEALALEEAARAAVERTLPESHSRVQSVRYNLAKTLKLLGRLDEAQSLEESVLDVLSRELPDDHPSVQLARQNLAVTLSTAGESQRARELEEAVLAARTRTLPDDHPDLQTARLNLASTIAAGIAAGARNPESEAAVRERARCTELIDAVCRSQVAAARVALHESSVRQAEERCAGLAASLDKVISFAQGMALFEPDLELVRSAFALSEATRAAGLASARLAREARGFPEYDRMRAELREAGAELARLVQVGTKSDEYHRARARREDAERELARLSRDFMGGAELLDPGPDALAAGLGEGDVAVAYRRYRRYWFADVDLLSSESMCAFVLRRGDTGAQVDVVELGPVEPIDDAVRAWREEIGAGMEIADAGSTSVARGGRLGKATTEAPSAGGDALRQMIWDPLLSEVGDAHRVIVTLDDVLHLVPLDALPIAGAGIGAGDGAPGSLVGHRWRIETRDSLCELVDEREPVPGGGLLALGGAAFDAAPTALAEQAAASAPAFEGGTRGSGLLRGGPWEGGFAPLPGSAREAREIAALHDRALPGDEPALVLVERDASRAALEELASEVRFLHIATHGWFAPDSIRSWTEVAELDAQSGTVVAPSERAVRGMSPMLLCGLALAGANQADGAHGGSPGLVTAEELSTLDLVGCELAVLSACDTHAGERNSGQGVASLQKALRMAGARSVVSSLWKVPDDATRELMLEFYRLVWVEGRTKHDALWAAKMKLRDARDGRGVPLHPTRDWAAWVLTGEPD